MAGIDKTYVSSFKEYNEIREWSKHTHVKYLNGQFLAKNISIA